MHGLKDIKNSALGPHASVRIFRTQAKYTTAERLKLRAKLHPKHHNVTGSIIVLTFKQSFIQLSGQQRGHQACQRSCSNNSEKFTFGAQPNLN